MSVIIYIYPEEPRSLSRKQLFESLATQSDGFYIVECESRSRSIPDWGYLLIAHESHKNLRFEFVVARNNRTNVQELEKRFNKHQNMDVVRRAKNYIWSKLKTGNATDRELTAGFTTYDQIINLLAHLSMGIVDLPENGKLYSSSGFARYKNAKQSKLLKRA